MTRTARSMSMRALLRDRAESRTGMDKHTPKKGAGYHNWGALANERELEDAAEEDEALEFEEHGTPLPNVEPAAPAPTRRTLSLSEADIQTARDFRRKAFKGKGIDLSEIARTSAAVSGSPPSFISLASGRGRSNSEASSVKSA